MTFRSLSITWKLTLTMLFLTTLISVSEIMLFTIYDVRTYLSGKALRMRTLTEVIRSNSTAALQFRDRNDAEEILRSLRAEKSIRAAYLFDEDGGVLVQYLREGEKLSVPLIAANSAEEYFDADNYTIIRTIVLGGQVIGSLYVNSDLDDIRQSKHDRYLLGALSGLGFFVFSFLLALWLQRIFTKPIQELSTTIHHVIGERDYAVRAPKSSSDEFGALVDGFNSMLGEIATRDRELAKHMALLERTNRELDQFVYVASHDLKAPLRAIESLSRLIAKATKELLAPDKQEYLELMQNRVRRMEALLDDLLAYSRVGRIEVATELVNSTLLVRNIIDLLSPPEGMTVIVADDLPVLQAERTPLEQVFRNLIGNAIKHHGRPEGRIEVSARDLGDAIEFYIADDGPGIPPQYHEKIFQMFQTLKPRDEVEGSGMGLALVKKIVEDQKGKIWLRSAEGQGSSFYFTWPKL